MGFKGLGFGCFRIQAVALEDLELGGFRVSELVGLYSGF